MNFLIQLEILLALNSVKFYVSRHLYCLASFSVHVLEFTTLTYFLFQAESYEEIRFMKEEIQKSTCLGMYTKPTGFRVFSWIFVLASNSSNSITQVCSFVV